MTAITPKRAPSLQPRKRPRQSRAERTVEAVVEAAARVLEDAGREGLNTNRVAERAGVSVGSLYQYFPGKDALVLALCRRERDAFLAEARDALDEPTGRAALERLIAASVRQQLRRPALARRLDAEASRPPIAGELAPFLAAMGEVVKQVLTRPDLPPPPDLEAATGDLMAIVRGLVNAAGERGETDRAGLERRVGRALSGYLRIEPGVATPV